mmetsp:Transcript_53211/g.142325  ORF Transcript_53211/g.142325 Transcript_53211/m.142325 type:complete len:441 (-) Transcript_53211:123-1445(-)
MTVPRGSPTVYAIGSAPGRVVSGVQWTDNHKPILGTLGRWSLGDSLQVPQGALVFEICNQQAGMLIGKGGQTIISLRQKSGARLQVNECMRPGGGERVVAIAGSLQQVHSCAEHVIFHLAKLGRNQEDDKEKTVELTLVTNHMGAIIGKGGENIKSIREETGVRINVEKGDNFAKEAERTADISGPAHVVSQCMSKVASLLFAAGKVSEEGTSSSSSVARKSTRKLSTPRSNGVAAVGDYRCPDVHTSMPQWLSCNPPHAIGRGSAAVAPVGGFVRERGKQKRVGFETSVLVFEVSNQLAGLLIGKSGSTIKSVRKSSGAKLQVTENTRPGGRERVVSLDGDAEQVERCISEVFQNFAKPGRDMDVVPGHERDVEITLVIPTPHMGGIIGEGINAIQEESGVRIEVCENASQDAPTTATMNGRADQVGHALKKVANVLFN